MDIFELARMCFKGDVDNIIWMYLSKFMWILNQKTTSGVESFEVVEGLFMAIFDKVNVVLKPRTTSRVGE